MEKRYQIFISSTYKDLLEERDKVMRAILELKCFPAGMELFPAVDKKKFEYIKSVIDECDFYILIIGARYGSLDNKGVSWTEREYNYAVRKHIPVLAFIHNDIEKVELGKADLDTVLFNKLEAFKKKVEKSPIVNYWGSSEELKSKVLASLHEAFSQYQNGEKGWVRIKSYNNGDLQGKLDKVEKELKTTLQKYRYLEDEKQKRLEEFRNKIHELRSQENKNDEDRLLLEKSYHISLEKTEELQKELAWYQNEVKKLKDSLIQKEDDCSLLESSYQLAQQDIKHLQDQIKGLEDRIKKMIDTKPCIKQLSPKLQKSSYIETYSVNNIAFNMVYIEGGSFMMGAMDNNIFAAEDEKPVHKVTLSDYWIGETQVTQALWFAVMGNNPSSFKGNPNRPVESVSWYECQKFIDKLNDLTGLAFHIPTEAQWEFAARGGKNSKNKFLFSGSNSIREVAWYSENSDGAPHPVKGLKPNSLGVYDMSGNVWEWCQDWYGRYNDDVKKDPIGPQNGIVRVIRGGGWNYDSAGCRVSFRARHSLIEKNNYIGLRLSL